MVDLLNLIPRLSSLLTDEDFDFWTKSFITQSINEAVRQILRYRNDANIKRFTVSGSNPISLDEKTISLISVDGLVIGGKIVKALKVKSKKELDNLDITWRDTCGLQTDHVGYDIENKKEMWASPPLGDDESITVILSVLPNAITETSSVLEFDILYEADIINYCLYRAYQREGTQGNKEAFYHKKFLEGLGVKTEGDNYFKKIRNVR